MKKIFFILTLIISLSGFCFAQIDYNQLEKGIVYIYNLKFDSAQFVFEQKIKTQPDNPSGYFFLAMIDWWKININKYDTSHDDEFISKLGKVIDICDKLLDKNEEDEYALFFKGGALGYRGLIRSLRDSWLKAAEDGKEALNLLKRVLEINPQNKDAILGIGIYNYFAEYVPDLYPALKPLMLIFPGGDKIKGLTQIKESAFNSVYAKYESKYILSYIYLLYEKNYTEAEKYSKSLNEEFPDNPVFEKYLCNSYVGMNKWPEALDGWNKILKKSEDSISGYTNLNLKREAYYYISLSFLKMNQLTAAEDYLFKCESLTKILDKEDTAFGAFTYMLIGMYYDLKNDKKLSSYYYDKVINMTDFQNSREDAERLKKYGYRQ